MCTGVSIARTGEMVYAAGETPIQPGPDGKVIVQRDAREVFRPETIASFQGKSLTLLHPKDFVNSKNWVALTRGVVQNVRRGTGEQESDLVADIIITEKDAIEKVKGGMREVSCGYEAEYTETGVGRGFQSRIIGNHLALVEEGRAGAAYAIIDHKGDSSMTISEKVKALFAKAQDEALKLVAGETKDEAEPKKEEKKEESKDAGYEGLMKAVKDLGDKVEAMMPKGKDASTEPTQSQPAEVVAKDDEVAPSLEDRMAKLEAAVAKLLEGQAVGDEDVVEVEAEDEECDDEDLEEGEMVGDTAARVEILAPGMDAKSKDVKVKALTACYATKDGKAIIEKFTGGKAPNFKDAASVETLFVAASELLKSDRTEELSRTRAGNVKTLDAPKGAMTADEMNARNAKHYGLK